MIQTQNTPAFRRISLFVADDGCYPRIAMAFNHANGIAPECTHQKGLSLRSYFCARNKKPTLVISTRVG